MVLPWQHFCQGALGQKFQFFAKNRIFYFKMYLYRMFWLEFEISVPELTPCTKFQLHWTKDKGTQILTWNTAKNGLMTSYLPPSDDVS